MPLTVGTPCDEDWDAMEVRGRGRHCASCDHIVVDLSRMTRARAEAFVRDRRGHRICGRLLIDGDTGEPVYAPSETKPARFRGGLVLAAAIGGAGCASTEPSASTEVTEEPAPVAMPPMEPVSLASTVAPAPEPVTGPVPAAELNDPDAAAAPTAEQERLTASKRARRHPPVAASPPGYPPNVYPLMGDIME
ncbi:MAG: hypothetical protein KC619_01345 [Myxococcales bacterium]|nr:hypothetical protein [Myxococcales bacterium]